MCIFLYCNDICIFMCNIVTVNHPDIKDLELYDLCTKNSKDTGGSYYLAPAVDLSPLNMQDHVLQVIIL